MAPRRDEGDSAAIQVTKISPGDHKKERKDRKNNAATAASAAGVRALSAQVLAFYFRAPVKAFFRTRIDYLAYARYVHNERVLATAMSRAEKSSWHQVWLWARGTTPGLITSVIQQHGWRVVPEQILPPLVANVTIGAVLYTSYLQILGRLHEESSHATRRVYPPPQFHQTFTAGLLAGGIQSFVAAPLDAIQARFDHRDLMHGSSNGQPRSMWSFSREKLREIGARGVFAGWGLSLMKDSLGSAVFFSMFEYTKAQAYYRFVTWYYGSLNEDVVNLLARKRPAPSKKKDIYDRENKVITPHYAIEPMFLLFAGVGASFTQQLVLHPMTHFQVKHWDHLEELDARADRIRTLTAQHNPLSRFRMLTAYYRAYKDTLTQCAAEAAREGKGLIPWLYRGFIWNTVRQVPSTSAGLVIFELVRRKYGMGDEEIRITRGDYDILLQ